MNGTKPSTDMHIIVRSFRGQQLVLVAYDGRNGFHWHRAPVSNPLKLPREAALAVAAKAAREYGAECATLAADGSMQQPAAARKYASHAEQRRAESAPLTALRRHVTGAIERGEATAITEQRTDSGKVRS